jgi:hypothetical protein
MKTASRDFSQKDFDIRFLYANPQSDIFSVG